MWDLSVSTLQVRRDSERFTQKYWDSIVAVKYHNNWSTKSRLLLLSSRLAKPLQQVSHLVLVLKLINNFTSNASGSLWKTNLLMHWRCSTHFHSQSQANCNRSSKYCESQFVPFRVQQVDDSRRGQLQRRRMVRGVLPPLHSGLYIPISNPLIHLIMILRNLLYTIIIILKYCNSSSFMLFNEYTYTTPTSSATTGSSDVTPDNLQGWRRITSRRSGSKLSTLVGSVARTRQAWQREGAYLTPLSTITIL